MTDDDSNYQESSTIFVAKFINLMVVGGVFKNKETLEIELERRGWTRMDHRTAKILIIQEFLKDITEFRNKNLQ